MQPHSQTFPVLAFVGVVVQLGGALMLIALFLTLRRFVLRRAYFTAWAAAWVAFAVAIAALVVRYILVPGITGMQLEEGDLTTRGLYLVYQASKVVGFVFFVRGTLIYLVGTTAGVRATRHLWLVRRGLRHRLVDARASRPERDGGLAERHRLPVLGYCAWTMLSLPRPRRTAGSTATGAAFGAPRRHSGASTAAVFVVVLVGAPVPFVDAALWIIAFNSYLDLSFNVLLGYSMILLLMEDAKREVDDAQSELRLTHDRLRRAALYDPAHRLAQSSRVHARAWVSRWCARRSARWSSRTSTI